MSLNTVSNKLRLVIDDLCASCAQCYEGECRAYQQPHNDIERAQRQADPQGLCEISVLRWSYEIGHPERLKPAIERSI